MMILCFFFWGVFFVFLDNFFVFFLGGFFIMVMLFYSLSSDMGFFDCFFFFDYYSFLLFFLTGWIIVFCMFSFFLKSKNYYKFVSLYFIFFLLLLVFSVDNFFLFYFFFEFVFFVMFFYLMSWGTSMERYSASFYVFFYTLIFSLPFFVLLISFYYFSGTFSFFFCLNSTNVFFCFFLYMVFFVKMPMYGVHLWLPKAHVEAPVEGSMLLAGIMLKLSCYGIYRFLSFFSMLVCLMSYGFDLCFYFFLLGSIFIFFVCIRQNDFKSIIAYSSIIHMGMLMMGLFSFSFVGFMGSIFMMISHGFVSSCLFYLYTFVYMKVFSRSIFFSKGFFLFLPFFWVLWIFCLVLNLGFPFTMSFFSEIFIIMGVGCLMNIDFLLVLLLLFFCGVYNVYLYVVCLHGKSFFSSFFVEFFVLFLVIIHLFFVVMFGFFFF